MTCAHETVQLNIEHGKSAQVPASDETTHVECTSTLVDAQSVRTDVQTSVNDCRHFADENKCRTETNHSLVVEIRNKDFAITKSGHVTWKIQLCVTASLKSVAVTDQQLSVRVDDTDALWMITVTALTDDVPTAEQTVDDRPTRLK